jgi:hypothetical protein
MSNNCNLKSFLLRVKPYIIKNNTTAEITEEAIKSIIKDYGGSENVSDLFSQTKDSPARFFFDVKKIKNFENALTSVQTGEKSIQVNKEITPKEVVEPESEENNI